MNKWTSWGEATTFFDSSRRITRGPKLRTTLEWSTICGTNRMKIFEKIAVLEQIWEKIDDKTKF